MRILIDLQSCQSASRERGIGRYSHALAVTLAGIAGQDEIELLLNAGFPESVEWIRERFRDSIPAARIHVFAAPGPSAEIDPLNAWRTRAAEHVREAFVASLRPDIVLLSSLFEGFVDDAITSIVPAPGRLDAVTLYDLIPLLRQDVLATPASRSWYERKLAQLRGCELLLAISEHARTEAIDALGLPAARIAVISTAADPCFRPPAEDDGQAQALLAHHAIARPYVLYAGGFDERKNVRNAIAAYAALPSTLRERHQLVLAGHIDGRERALLRSAGERGGLRSGELVFTGYVDDADLAGLYGHCEVFVCPSLHEGFGLPVLEAMSCGAAVVGSNTTSIPEVIGRADALFDPTDVHAISGRLHTALTDPGFRSDLRRHGLARAATFSWHATAIRALDALRDAHARHARVAPIVGPPACAPTIDSPTAPMTGSATAPIAAWTPTTQPSLAYVSPLPPERTGVGYYSVELLAPLREHYRIELVTDQQVVDVPAELADLPVRALEEFDAQGDTYDRVLYQLGNSPFHQRMFDLLERHPGTVVLHDLYMGGVLNWMDRYGPQAGVLMRSLFESHGYPGLIADRDRGREAVIDAYPCSWRLIERANGVVVHSLHALNLAAASFRISAQDWRCIPQLRRLPALGGREAARRELGIGAEDVLFCSFGFLDATKLDDRIVDAWLGSKLAVDPRCTLVFVGENHGGEYGQRLQRRIAESGARIRITGYVDAAAFDRYLRAADVAIQLRGATHGETSRTVLDCLAHGLPLVANASASLGEFADDVLLRVPADFTDLALADALQRLAFDAALRERLGGSARRHVADHHDPGRVAAEFRDAIEAFAREGPRTRYARLLGAVAGIAVEPEPAAADWRAAAQSIAIDLRRPAARQILVDVSILAKQDLRTGIERVVRAVLRELLERAPRGWRVEPVVAADECYLYARQFTSAWLDLPASVGEDTPIDIAPGDAFVGLDWAANIVPDQQAVLQRYRTLGVRVTFVIYDLLPVLRPDFYPPGIDAMHRAWLAAVADVADGVLCISQSVADELVTWLDAHAPHRASALDIGVLPLGADFERSVPSTGRPADAERSLEALRSRTSVLMVGTVEPRKGHAQALAAFEMLWRKGEDVNLVIVGKQGWMVDALALRMREHPEQGQRLFWFPDASDEWLDAVYGAADVLLAASLGEGYGLPLAEAARQGVPLLVRDLPVFREVAGEHATYFTGLAPEDLAGALLAWKRSAAAGSLPNVGTSSVRSWRDCVDALLSAIVDGQWPGQWRPLDAARSGGAPSANVREIDFSQARPPPAVRTIKGLSAREHWGRWSDADVHPRVEIRFREPLPARGALALTARAYGPNIGQPMSIRIGGHETALRFDACDSTAVATYALQQAPLSLEITPPHPVRPRDIGASQDPRRLGIGLVRLTITSA